METSQPPPPPSSLHTTSSQSSCAAQHVTIEPISSAILIAEETRRRDALRELGPCWTGCREVDEYVLLGGFERGCVVGVSAEEEDEMGVLMGLQVVAHELCADARKRALVVTPKPAGAILGKLRDVTRAELASQDVNAETAGGRRGSRDRGRAEAALRNCLDRVMLSCVFDMDGLSEVLEDLDMVPAENTGEKEENRGAEAAHDTRMSDGGGEGEQDDPLREATTPEASPPAPRDPSSSPLSSIMEIQDSQDEDGASPAASSQPLPSPLPPSPAAAAVQPPATRQTPPQAARPTTATDTASTQPLPDIILITHFSSLLSSLFTHRENSAAHAALQLLSSHLRYLSRTLPSHPLIILLNSTSSSSAETSSSTTSTTTTTTPAQKPPSKPIDPTLRSVFNPAPLPIPGYTPAPRRNKPTFGLVFAQLLDMHLLCTRVPRSQADADAVYAPSGGAAGGAAPRFVTVVEVLLDELGVWEGRTGPRKSREQRWAAVQRDKARIRDAFALGSRERAAPPELRLSAGFGGPRV